MNAVGYGPWMAMLMVVNCITFSWFAYSFIRWRQLSSRDWVRRAFLLGSIASILLVMFRFANLLIFDSVFARVVFVTYFTFGSLIIAAMFALATNMMHRRVKHMEATVSDDLTSDLIEGIIVELRDVTNKSSPDIKIKRS